MIGTGKESHTFIHNNRDEHKFLGVGYKRDIFFAIKTPNQIYLQNVILNSE